MLIQGTKHERLNVPGLKTHFKPFRAFAPPLQAIPEPHFVLIRGKKQKELFSFLTGCFQDLANFLF